MRCYVRAIYASSFGQCDCRAVSAVRGCRRLPPGSTSPPTQPVPVIRLRPGAVGTYSGTGLAPLGAGAQLGQRPGHRQPPDQRPGRDGSGKAGLSGGPAAAAMPGRGRRLLRVAAGRPGEAAATSFVSVTTARSPLPACGKRGKRARPVAARNVHAVDHRAERSVASDPRPHAGDPLAATPMRIWLDPAIRSSADCRRCWFPIRATRWRRIRWATS